MNIDDYKLLKILEQADLGVWLFELASNKCFISEKLKLWLGLDSSYHNKDRLIALVDECWRQNILNILDHPKNYENEFHQIPFMTNEEMTWLSIKTNLFKDHNNQEYLSLICEKIDYSQHISSSILENSTELVWVIDLEGGKLVYTNHEDKNNPYGLPIESFKDNPDLWLEKIYPEDRTEFEAKIDLLLRGKIEVLEHEYRLIRPNGELLWVRNRANLFKDNKTIYIHGKMTDINDEKEKDSLNNKIQTIGKIGGWELDAKTHFTKWTNETYKIHGLPLGTMTDKIMGINFFEPHERVKINNFIEEGLKGHPYRAELEFIDALGEKKWVQTTGEPVFDNNGEVIKLIGTFQDISELKNKDKNLEIILENITDGYWDYNYEKEKEFVSNNFWSHLGWDKKRREVYNIKSWKDIVHKGDLRELLKSFENQQEYIDKKFRTSRVRIKNSKNQWFWFEHTWSVVSLDKKGKPIRMVGTFTDISENVEEKQKFEDYHKGLNEYAIIAETDKFGKITWVNDNFCKISGYKREELIGQTHQIINSGHHAKSFFQIMWETIKKGNIWRGEIKNKTKNGSYYWVDTIIIPKKNINGEVISFIAFRYEITDRKLNEFQINNFFNLGINYLAIASPDGYFKSVNPHWLNLGYSKQELLSQPFINFVHPDDLEKTYHEASKLDNHKYKTIDFTNRYRKKDGSYIFMQWKASSDPETGLIYAVCTDVSEQIREGVLAETINKLRSMFISFKHDRSRILEEFNKTVSDYLGSDATVIHLDYEKKVKYFYKNNRNIFSDAKDQTFSSLFKIMEKQDNPIYVNSALISSKLGPLSEKLNLSEYHIIAPINYNKSIKGVVIINNKREVVNIRSLDYLSNILDVIGELLHNIDITEELEMQRQITMHSSKLASIGEMAADVGHEINNPLAIISGQVATIKKRLSQDGRLDESYQGKWVRIEKSIKRIQNIVTGMRGLARSDALDRGTFSFSELVSETCEMLEEIYTQDGIQLDCHIQENIYFNGHRGRLQQVLVNLLNNARDAVSNRERRQIYVEVLFKTKQVFMCIKDTGIGMTPEVKEKVFEPFFTTKQVNKGTGIGMALVHSIVSEHKGQIEINSSPGIGTEICITLPEIEQPDHLIAGEEIVANNLYSISKSMKLGVLIVDDEEDITEIVSEYISDHTSNIFVAVNATQAMEIYKQNRDKIDLIISDIKMPNDNGIEFLTSLIDDDFKAHFYFMTGGVKLDIEPYKSHIDGIIHKPFNQREIAQVIEETIRRLQAQRQSA